MSKIVHFDDRLDDAIPFDPLLFAALSPATQARLRDGAVVRRFATGALIQHRGEMAEGFWLIEEGTVAAGQFLDHGEFRAIRLFGPGESYGELAVLSHRPRIVDAVAREPTVLRYIRGQDFEQALADDPPSMRSLLGGMAAQLQDTVDIMAGIRRGTAIARTAALLASLAVKSSDPRRVSVTQQEVAELLGITRGTANAALRALEAAGLLRRGYGAVEILDAEGLRRTTFA